MVGMEEARAASQAAVTAARAIRSIRHRSGWSLADWSSGRVGSATRMVWGARLGTVLQRWSVGPKRAIAGMLKAVAMKRGPVSLVTIRRLRRMRALSVPRLIPRAGSGAGLVVRQAPAMPAIRSDSAGEPVRRVLRPGVRAGWSGDSG